MENKLCTRCVMDTTAPNIQFDHEGVCNFCHIHDALEKKHPLGIEGAKVLSMLVNDVKASGKGKKYDCVIGVSGGRDSTYTLYIAKKLGLRPLAVHFDNGWNSDIAVTNIKEATQKLGIDLYTVVADWEEFKDLQKSFLKASVSDAEVPTDWVITSVLYSTAAKHGITYVIEGHSFRTEGSSPIGWTYIDGKYLKSVHKIFGSKKITSFPIMMMSQLLHYLFVKRIKMVRLMEYIDYRQKEASEVIKKELGWKYYGGHHHENLYTKFFQSYYLPKKFGIDKRKTEFSALIRSGQKDRNEALNEIKTNYPFSEQDVEYTIKKLELTQEEFTTIMNSEIKSFHDYPTYYPLIQVLKIPIKIACKMNLLPKIVQLKYVK